MASWLRCSRDRVDRRRSIQSLFWSSLNIGSGGVHQMGQEEVTAEGTRQEEDRRAIEERTSEQDSPLLNYVQNPFDTREEKACPHIQPSRFSPKNSVRVYHGACRSAMETGVPLQCKNTACEINAWYLPKYRQ